jgi:hypothetical protein
VERFVFAVFTTNTGGDTSANPTSLLPSPRKTHYGYLLHYAALRALCIAVFLTAPIFNAVYPLQYVGICESIMDEYVRF